MPSVALIGPDGAGKTTLTRMLERSDLLPFRYLYMGIDIPASNIALPTSRLVERWKSRAGSGRAAEPAGDLPASPRPAAGRRVLRSVWAAARLGNRLAEECFRQGVSWWYELRGWTVLYDRHYVFDFAPELTAVQRDSLDKRIHHWFLSRLYPRPSLVIFLDAPGTVLFARKGELTASELERRRQAFLQVGRRVPNFVRVDATRPLTDVYDEIVRLVVEHCGASAPERTSAAGEIVR